MRGVKDAVTITEAKAHLSALVARAERGEVIIVRRGKKAVAKIVALEPTDRLRRPVVGALRGQIWIADDFVDLGPEWAAYR